MSSLNEYIARSEASLRDLREADLEDEIGKAATRIVEALAAGKPLLICGNGGSASDAEHIAGELVGRFMKNRQPYNVISLVSNAAVLTAWSNDFEYETVFSRQVEAHGTPGGVLLAISTSGNSGNVVKAAESARALGMSVTSMTGVGGGRLAALSDVLLDVPSNVTALVQQGHITLYHHLCFLIEERLAPAAS